MSVDDGRAPIPRPDPPQPSDPPPPPPEPPAPTPGANTIRLKLRVAGDAPDRPASSVRVRCLDASGGRDDQVVALADGPALEVVVAADHPRCIVHQLDAGGASSTRYQVHSLTAETSDRPRSGRVFFTGDGGERARVVVTSGWSGACPDGRPRC